MDTGLISEQDATVLLRLVIVLESRLLGGELDVELTGDLQRQFQRSQLIEEPPPPPPDEAGHEDVGPALLRLALDNLNQRLRYALGDYDEPPETDLGWTNQYFGFPSTVAADTFLTEARTAGERGLDRVTRPAESTSTIDACRWEVVLTIRELPMTAAYDEHVKRLFALAFRHGGSYRGSGGPVSTDAH